MKVESTTLAGVLRITPPTVFNDGRGSYVETYNEGIYAAAGITVKFVQDDISTSRRDVLRGIHGDAETWKLISCVWGEFILAVLNYDKASAQFGRWELFTLSDRNRHQILVPPKFGNGHLVRSDWAIFQYKQSTYYNRAGQFTVAWNDPRFKIPWGIERPITSERDRGIDGD